MLTTQIPDSYSNSTSEAAYSTLKPLGSRGTPERPGERLKIDLVNEVTHLSAFFCSKSQSAANLPLSCGQLSRKVVVSLLNQFILIAFLDCLP